MPLTRREWLGSMSLLPLFNGVKTASGNPVSRPNILWILAEDLSPDLGCYGVEQVHTPRIDRLAEQGILYSNTFVTCPVCSPSRSAFNTGMYQTSIGAHNHRSHCQDTHHLPEGVRLLSDWLRDAGYFTANITRLNEQVKGTGKTDFNFHHPRSFDGTHWNQRKPGQPFYAQINLSESHRDFVRDPETPVDPETLSLPPYYPDHPIARRDWADYLETNQVLDRRVGAILDALEADGLAESTIVIFMGDNGRCDVRGKQWLYEGGIHVPLIVRWPDGRHAGNVHDGMVSAIDVSASILAMAGVEPPETIQGRPSLTGDAPFRSMIFSARDRCDETVDRIRCVRTSRYKLIRNYYPERPYAQINRYKETQYPVLRLMRRLHDEGNLSPEAARFMAESRPSEELYDLQTDPHELNNRIEDPGLAWHASSLRRFLDRWIETKNDQGAIPEDPSIPARYEARMRANYEEQRKALYEEEGMPWMD